MTRSAALIYLLTGLAPTHRQQSRKWRRDLIRQMRRDCPGKAIIAARGYALIFWLTGLQQMGAPWSYRWRVYRETDVCIYCKRCVRLIYESIPIRGWQGQAVCQNCCNENPCVPGDPAFTNEHYDTWQR
ncbi:MAG: hypothetical protein U0990_09395 [Candidatus Nanopelagicales bacterium]|nr:hypothetical protein [Candidatus Nanopelagicales bacterium]